MSQSKTLERVIKQLEERERRGVSKYGTTVDRQDLEEWQWAQHAKEEAMDLVLYLQRLQDQIQQRELVGKYAASVARSLEIRSPSGAGGSQQEKRKPSGPSVWRRLLRLIAPASMPSSGNSFGNDSERRGGV